MPTYLYLPVMLGHPSLVGFEEAPADGHCASSFLQCRQVIRVINRLSSNLERVKPKMSVSFDISRLPFIGIPHPYYVPLLVLSNFEIGRSRTTLVYCVEGGGWDSATKISCCEGRIRTSFSTFFSIFTVSDF